MNMETNEPEYLAAVVREKPRIDDEREIAIAKKIGDSVLSEQWAREAFATIRELQIVYMREALAHIDNPAWVYNRTQEVLAEISRLSRSEIVEGAELLRTLPKGQPALIMTNHLGTYKLAGIDPKKELGVDIPGYNFMYPSPMYFGGLLPVTKAIGDNLSYVSNDFPGQLGTIHRESGFIHVPPKSSQQAGRTGALLEQTRAAFAKHPNSAIVNYPEGGTSGKYTGLGPYDLDPFKTGGYVIAAQLGVRVIPVAQYFDPEHGLQLKVFAPRVPDESAEKETIRAQAELDRKGMQEWFDKHQADSRHTK